MLVQLFKAPTIQNPSPPELTRSYKKELNYVFFLLFLSFPELAQKMVGSSSTKGSLINGSRSISLMKTTYEEIFTKSLPKVAMR